MAPKGKKKTAAKKPQAKPSRTGLTAERLEHFKQLLLVKRRELLQNVNHMEDEALRKSLQGSGDLSSMPIHMADLGSDNYEQDLAVGLMDGERRLLQEIDRALDRIENGAYGICEGTDRPIPRARLEAMPWARYCIEYERMIERGQDEA
jgi:DnaK suppressor protein